jgi:hypothetical protein
VREVEEIRGRRAAEAEAEAATEQDAAAEVEAAAAGAASGFSDEISWTAPQLARPETNV